MHLTVSSLAFMLSGYIVNIWLGKKFGPGDYGIYGVIISLMTMINIIQTSGLPQAASRFIAAKPESAEDVLHAALRAQILSTIGISFLFFMLSRPLALLLNDISLMPYIEATSLILPFYSVFALYTGYYNGLHNFRKQAMMYIIYSGVKLVAVIGLIYVFHLYGAIIGFIIAPLAALLFGSHLPRSTAEGDGLSRRLIVFSLPLIGFAVLSTLLISVDLFFVKSLLAEGQAAGLYTASQNIARIPYFALAAFAAVLFPTVARSMAREEARETGKKIRDNLRYLLLLLIPSTALIMMTSADVLRLMYSSSYLPAAASLSWLALGLAFISIFVILANVINAAEKPSTSMLIAAIGVGVTSLFCFLLVPERGFSGAALATTAGGAVTMLLALIAVARRFPRIIPWSGSAKMMVAALGMYAAHAALHFSFILLPLSYLVLLGIYALVLVILGEIGRADISAIKALLPRRAPLINLD